MLVVLSMCPIVRVNMGVYGGNFTLRTPFKNILKLL